MSQKVITVPGTTNLTSPQTNIKLDNRNNQLLYNNGVSFQVPIKDDYLAYHIKLILDSLKLNDVKGINGYDENSIATGDITEIKTKLRLFNQWKIDNTEIKLEKVKLGQHSLPPTKLTVINEDHNETPDTSDVNYLINRAFNILKSQCTSGLIDTNLSHIATLFKMADCKIIKLNIMYQTIHDASYSKFINRVRDISIEPEEGITNIDENFSVEIKGNKLRVLKSWNIDQLFIRNINLIN